MPGNKWSALVWSARVPDGFTSKATSIRLLRSPKINKPLWSCVFTAQVAVIDLDLFHIDSFIIMILFKRGALWRTHEPWHLKFVRNITDYWLRLAGLEGTEGFTDIRWEPRSRSPSALPPCARWTRKSSAELDLAGQHDGHIEKGGSLWMLRDMMAFADVAPVLKENRTSSRDGAAGQSLSGGPVRSYKLMSRDVCRQPANISKEAVSCFRRWKNIWHVFIFPECRRPSQRADLQIYVVSYLLFFFCGSHWDVYFSRTNTQPLKHQTKVWIHRKTLFA